MAYTPPSFDNIIIGMDTLPPYNPPNYNNIIISENPGIGRYAIVRYANGMGTISDTLLGTGLKPLVWENGDYHIQQDNEGTPLVFVNGELSTLPDEDYLVI